MHRAPSPPDLPQKHVPWLLHRAASLTSTVTMAIPAALPASGRPVAGWNAVAGLMSDPLLAQFAVDRFVATSYELVIEGESYRRRQRPGRHNQPAADGVS